MEVRTGKDSTQSILLVSFAVISFVSIIIRLGWKYLHILVPRLPFKPKWPNFVIGFCQFVPYILLLLAILSWYRSDVTANATDFGKVGDYVKGLENQTKSADSKLSKIRYPSHSQVMLQFFPREVFEVRVRYRVMERYSNAGVEEFEQWKMENKTCEALTVEMMDVLAENVKIFKNNPLDISTIGKSMDEWKHVQERMKNDQEDMRRLAEEKTVFQTHLKKTRTMYMTILQIWKRANDVFKNGILKITQNKNKEVYLVYGASAAVTIYFGFWSILITLLLSQYHMPRMWLTIMKTCFYICAAQAIFLSAFKYNQNNEFECRQYSRNFELFNFDIPSFQDSSRTDTMTIFTNCVRSGKSIFSNGEVRAKTTTFIDDTLENKTQEEVKKVLSVAKLYDKVVKKRRSETVTIIDKLAKVRKQCPEVEQVIDAFNSTANLLLKYILYEIKEEASSRHAVNMPMSQMEKFLHEPVLEFNKIVTETSFDCRDAYNTYVLGYNLGCTAVNSVVVEHLEMMVIACSSLLAFFHLFFLRRADHTQFWNDVRVRWAQKLFHNRWDEEQYEEWEYVDAFNPAGATYHHFTKARNMKKNRYPDVGLIDQTRVVLRNHTTDYIHASWIPVPGTTRRYIATQGPLPNTFPDFWHMIWQEDVKIIMMCSGFIEMDRRQCGYYFPSTPGQKMIHGNYEISCVDSFDPTWGSHTIWHTTTRTLKLVDKSIPDCEPKTVKHVYMWHWFDYQMPVSMDRIVFTHLYLNTLRHDDSPVVVHCDTGVGRAAAFIGVDVLKATVEQGKYESMVDVAHYMSSRRVGSFERHLDFIFCLASVLHWFIQEMILFDDDFKWPMKLYQDYNENKMGLQNQIRCKRETSIHYWKKFEDPAWFDTCEIKFKNKREEVRSKNGKGNKKKEKNQKKKK